MPLIIQRGGRGRLDEWLVPGRLISQWMELRAKMSLGFNPRQERLPLIMLAEERLMKMERKPPQQTKCSPKRWCFFFLT